MTKEEKLEKSKSEVDKSRYLNNTISYFKMLRQNDEKQVPKYKLESANFLSNMDIFLFKIRIILSIGGIIASAIFVLVLFNNFYQNVFEVGYIRSSTVPFLIFYLYISFFVGYYSFKVYKKTQRALKSLLDEVEE